MNKVLYKTQAPRSALKTTQKPNQLGTLKGGGQQKRPFKQSFTAKGSGDILPIWDNDWEAQILNMER